MHDAQVKNSLPTSSHIGIMKTNYNTIWEHSGSGVGGLTQDRGAAGSSLTSVAALCP